MLIKQIQDLAATATDRGEALEAAGAVAKAEAAYRIADLADDLAAALSVCPGAPAGADLCTAGLWDIDPRATCPICGALPDARCLGMVAGMRVAGGCA